MSRAIKFRAWDGHRMIVENVVAFTPQIPEATNIPSLAGTLEHGQIVPIFNGIPMQFTGIGNIYEDDIVRVYDNNRYCICDEWDGCKGDEDIDHKNHGDHKHEDIADCEKYVCTQKVEWTEEGGYFCEEEIGDFCPPLGSDGVGLEVIGNIYENPDLLAV